MSDQNPWNVKQLRPPDSWQGSHGQDERGHAIFADPAYSGRAALHILTRNLRGQQTHNPHRLDNFAQLLGDEDHGYAPASDTQGSVPGNPRNDPEDYARFLADATGIGPDFPLPDPALAPDTWCRVLHAMAIFENGHPTAWRHVFRSFVLWYKTDQLTDPDLDAYDPDAPLA